MRSKLLICLLFPAAAAAVALCVLHGHGFIHFFGIDTESSDNYNLISGIGPMTLNALGMTTLVSGLWRAHNCHAASCLRIGRYPIAGGQFRVCRKHHPHQQVRENGLTAESLGEIHRHYYQQPRS